MGSLTPGATYIYEKADGVTYAREFGSNERRAIGWDYEYRKKAEAKDNIHLWGQIHEAAKTNPALQEALDRVKIIYHLSKENGRES